MNVRMAVMPVVCLLVAAGSAFAQHRVDPGNMYVRIYAIVPMVGSGTWADPRRPMFAPVVQQPVADQPVAQQAGTQQTTPATRTGIIAFNSIESDDGNFALIEIVAANRKQLALITAQMTAAAVTGLQIFDRSTTPTATVQSAFQLLKQNFDITQFLVVVP